MMWFVEERRACAREWTPAVHRGDRPVDRWPDRNVRFRAEPVIVPEYLINQPLSVIAMCLAQDGEFFGMGDQVHRNIVEYLANPETFELVVQA